MRQRAHLRLVSSSETADPTLTAVLGAEDLAVELGLDPCARVTCGRHRCWSHQCAGRPGHVLPRSQAAGRQVELARLTSLAACTRSRERPAGTTRRG